MRGQYSHNNGVWSNSSTDSSSTDSGGWQAYQQNGNEADNVATRLQGAGYKTALFGKYLNRYANTTFKPLGWDRWFAAFSSGDLHYFDYDVNDQGDITHYGTSDSDYITDVISRQADAFIANSASQGTPFFAYVAPVAPPRSSYPGPARRARVRRHQRTASALLRRGRRLRQTIMDQAVLEALILPDLRDKQAPRETGGVFAGRRRSG